MGTKALTVGEDLIDFSSIKDIGKTLPAEEVVAINGAMRELNEHALPRSSPYFVNREKPLLDIEQLSWLITSGRLPVCFWEIVKHYLDVLYALFDGPEADKRTDRVCVLFNDSGNCYS